MLPPTKEKCLNTLCKFDLWTLRGYISHDLFGSSWMAGGLNLLSCCGWMRTMTSQWSISMVLTSVTRKILWVPCSYIHCSLLSWKASGGFRMSCHNSCKTLHLSCKLLILLVILFHFICDTCIYTFVVSSLCDESFCCIHLVFFWTCHSCRWMIHFMLSLVCAFQYCWVAVAA